MKIWVNVVYYRRGRLQGLSDVVFVIMTLDRPYYFCALSPEAMKIWVDVIFTEAEGYKAYQT